MPPGRSMSPASDVSDNDSLEHRAPDFCHYCNYFDEHEYLCDPTDPNVCEACEKLSELEEKVKETRKMLVGLENERRRLKERVNHHHDLIVHRLPFEVAANIFELCMPEGVMDSYLPRASRYTLSAPFILSAVCRQWRTIAHSTPRLWRTLLLRGSEDLDQYSFPEPWVVQNWIEHSGSHPLSINIRVYPKLPSSTATPDSDDSCQWILKIIKILNQYSDRWLQLKYKGPSYLLAYLSPHNEDLPQLRRLDFQVSRDIDLRPSQKMLTLRPKQLTALSLTELRIDADNFNWQHLTELELGSAVLSECFASLQKGSKLRRCIFRRPDQGRERRTRPPPIIVQLNIQYLEITGPLLYQEIIQYLSCPSLKTLVLSPGDSTDEMPLITEFLMRSGCALESFTIGGAVLSELNISLLCQAMPTLRHLRIDMQFRMSPPIGWTLFTHLAEYSIVDGRKVPRYLPLLSSLELNEDLEDDLSHWAILPEIFGALKSTNSSVDRHRCSLESITLSIRYSDWMMRPDIYNAISAQTLQRMLWLESEAGVKWDLQLARFEEDVFRPALSWYGISLDSLTQDDVEIND